MSHDARLFSKSDRVWFYLVVAFWVHLAVAAWIPASWWLTIHTLEVSDAYEGQPIVVSYDRTFHRQVRGSWVAVVYREGGQGRFYAYCAPARGSSIYHPDIGVPDTMSLGWLFQMTCPVRPGRYFLRVTYYLEPVFLPEKSVTATSNVFTVREVTQQ